MRLHYFHDPRGNFGDDLNPWLWDKLIPDLLDDDDSCLFVGVGTLLNDRLPAGPDKVIFGSGVGYGALPVLDERWHVYCVRGPLSAKVLGLPADVAVSDPALLVRDLVGAGRGGAGAVFMPHHASAFRASVLGLDLAGICDHVGVRYVDPTRPPGHVLDALSSADLVIAEAMHAAIVADALRVPWVASSLFGDIFAFKWNDWCASVSLPYIPIHVDVGESPTGFEQLLRRALSSGGTTSSEAELDGALDRLRAHVDQLRTDVKSGRYPTDGAMPAPPASSGPDEWHQRVLDAVAEITSHVPADSLTILIDGAEWPPARFVGGVPVLPFTEVAGTWNGPPIDDRHAIRELERMRGAGAQHLVVTWNAAWWLKAYPAFADHVQRTYLCVTRSDRCQIFDLRGG